MPTARIIKRYTCFECKTEHSEDNMVAYGACCYANLEAENERLRKIEAAAKRVEIYNSALCAECDHDLCNLKRVLLACGASRTYHPQPAEDKTICQKRGFHGPYFGPQMECLKCGEEQGEDRRPTQER